MTYAMEIERHRREAKNIGINIGINIGREEGLVAGREEGLAAGRKENSQKIALSMLEDKASIPLISKYTGLTEQEIHDLAKEHNLL